MAVILMKIASSPDEPTGEVESGGKASPLEQRCSNPLSAEKAALFSLMDV